MMEMNKVKKFETEDWYAFAGAMRFNNGSDPFIYRHMMNDNAIELVMIGDASGVQIIITDEYGNSMAWEHSEVLPPLKIEGIMRAIAKELQDYEYASDVAFELDHPYGDYNVFAGFEYLGEY